MRRWPWFTFVVAAVVALSPPGQGLLYLAFISNEQLSNNIGQPLVAMTAAVLLVVAALEWWIRRRKYGSQSRHGSA
jgi:membrane protein DedA with SNARE-associated domain